MGWTRRLAARGQASVPVWYCESPRAVECMPPEERRPGRGIESNSASHHSFGRPRKTLVVEGESHRQRQRPDLAKLTSRCATVALPLAGDPAERSSRVGGRGGRGVWGVGVLGSGAGAGGVVVAGRGIGRAGSSLGRRLAPRARRVGAAERWRGGGGARGSAGGHGRSGRAVLAGVLAGGGWRAVRGWGCRGGIALCQPRKRAAAPGSPRSARRRPMASRRNAVRLA